MNKIFLCSTFSILFLTSISYAQESLDGVAAVIGDELILKSEITAYSIMRLHGIGINPDSSKMKEYHKQFLQEMIDGKVLIAHAKKDSTISLTDADVDNALNNHIVMLMRQNNLTIESLEKELQNQQGISLAKFKSELRIAIREQLLKQKIQQDYLSSLKITRKEVENFYNQYKDSLPQAGESVYLQKLSLKIAPSDSIRQAAYNKILIINQKIDNGEDFGELAKRYSESPEATEGGDLGFISKGSLSELAFEEKAFSLKTGQISEPFESRLGFHIVNVLEKRDMKVHIRQIFIKVAPLENMIKKVADKLDSIRTTCKNSEEFNRLAEQLSVDPSAKNNKGNLGWISLLEMSSKLRDAVDGVSVGAISQSVFEDNIVSIYRVNDRVERRALTLENDYAILAEKAKDILSQKKLSVLVMQWKKDLFIDIRL